MKLKHTYGAFGLTVASALIALPSMAAEGEPAKAGLPQFDVSLFPAQLFWLAVTFGLLYVLMAFVALPRVKSTQDNRQQIIDTELAAARNASDSAKAMMAKSDKALADARANAMASVNNIKLSAGKESAEQQGRQQKEISQRLQQAETAIESARDAAIKDVETMAADLARAIVDKVVGAPQPQAGR